jgi:hypothetical protein
MCEIVIDTDTTGRDPLGGHRVVEIGAVEPCKEIKGQRISGVCLQSKSIS